MYQRWYDTKLFDLEQRTPYKTIVVSNENKEIIGFGSIQLYIVGQKKLEALICDIMVDPKYPNQSQLQHKIMCTLESLAWLLECKYVCIYPFQLNNDLIEDL